MLNKITCRLPDEVLFELTLRAAARGKSVEDEASEIILGAIINCDGVNPTGLLTGCEKMAGLSGASVYSSTETARETLSNEHSLEFMLGL